MNNIFAKKISGNNSTQDSSGGSNNVMIAILIAALGYFVDVYDLVLFSIVRVPSLKDMGLNETNVFSVGLHLLNMQMIGMLLGGIIWGIYGDIRGRISVLFGSIFIYSFANIANAYVQTVDQYSLLRFIAGVGLAGELGAGITLVSEIMSKEKRGIGTTLIASIGVLGAVCAAYIGGSINWRNAYLIGGILGLLLLALRLAVSESGMFKTIKQTHVRRGDLFLLFSSRYRFKKYISCILTGVPIWFVIGVLITFAPEIGHAAGITENIDAGQAIKYAYIGLFIGDLASGFLSQKLKSRKKTIILFLILNLMFTFLYLKFPGDKASYLYFMCLPLGFSVGYWAVFITVAAEQFGTNIRATVTTSVPNFVRGSTVVLSYCISNLKDHFSIVTSCYIVSLTCFIFAIISIIKLKETFDLDLDFIEVD